MNRLKLNPIALTIVLMALLLLGIATSLVDRHPRTDDATVRANVIPFAAEVEGKITSLNVHDNQFVRRGDVLFVIDPRPYRYALEEAQSGRDMLEGQIHDAQRHIAAESSAVEAASGELDSSVTLIASAEARVEATHAAAARAEAQLATANAQLALAQNDYDRIEPLLAKHFVTVQQVDEQSTRLRVAKRSRDVAQAQLEEARADEHVATAGAANAKVNRSSTQARLGQAKHTVDTLETLEVQRTAKDAAIERASLDLARCEVRAPFDGYVTNMNIANGAYAHVGASMFTLVDAENWWVVASYRESKLKHIEPGMHVDVFLMEHPEKHFDGVVDSIGWGVFPEDGAVADGLPSIDRTLNWVHLSARFPVRIRVLNPDHSMFRIGATAITVVR